MHALGRFSDTERKFVPKEDRGSLVVEARIMIALYLAILGASAWFNWWVPSGTGGCRCSWASP